MAEKRELSANAEVQFLVNQLAQSIQLNRMALGGFGTSNTKRGHLWQEFGYPEGLCFDDFYRAYERNSVAQAGVHAVLDNTWQDLPEFIDGEEDDDTSADTQFEKDANRLFKKFASQIKDADRRNMVGKYSAIIIQLADNKKLDQPVTGSISEQQIVRFVPVWESQLTVATTEEDITSRNYGLPTMYNFNHFSRDKYNNGPLQSTQVHPDRVIILAEGSEDGNPLSGIELNRAGFNDLLDIEKSKGGSAEGFLKNASRQLGIAFDPNTQMQRIQDDAIKAGYTGIKDAMNQQIKQMNSGTDSALVMQAGSANVLSVAAADPTPTFTVSAQCYASTIGCPFNILFGKQTGNLASTEDKTAWAKKGNARRQHGGFLNGVIRSVIDWFIKYKVIDLPSRGQYSVNFPDLLSPSDADKLANMDTMADIMQKATAALGRSPFDENEIRAVGGYEPIQEGDAMPTAPEVDDNEDNTD